MQGASTIEVFLDKYGYLWRHTNELKGSKAKSGQQLEDVQMKDENLASIKDELISICKMMLTVDPAKRPSAKDLLKNKIFTDTDCISCDPSELLVNIKGTIDPNIQLNEHQARCKNRAIRGNA